VINSFTFGIVLTACLMVWHVWLNPPQNVAMLVFVYMEGVCCHNQESGGKPWQHCCLGKFCCILSTYQLGRWHFELYNDSVTKIDRYLCPKLESCVAVVASNHNLDAKNVELDYLLTHQMSV
jgi:hypothetical protein